MRTNVDELQWVAADCKHTHHRGEWDPWWSFEESTWIYPSEEQAEYSAKLSFCMAVACSVWTIRTQGYKLQIPRFPIPWRLGTGSNGWRRIHSLFIHMR